MIDLVPTPRKPMTKTRKAAAFLANGGRCWSCGQKITGPYIVDHRVQLWLGGLDEVENLQVAHVQCDAPKTAKDATVRAKVRRIQMKHNGSWPRPVRQLQGRGFQTNRRGNT